MNELLLAQAVTEYCLGVLIGAAIVYAILAIKEVL